MAHTMGRPLTAMLVVSLTVLAPSAASASARPHPPARERFYCHRIVHPVAMHGYPWRIVLGGGVMHQPHLFPLVRTRTMEHQGLMQLNSSDHCGSRKGQATAAWFSEPPND